MSGLKLKKTWAVLLIALLLIFVSACSTPQTGEVAEEPGASTDNSETAQKDEPAEEPAEAQDDVPSYALDRRSLSVHLIRKKYLKAITTA